MNTATEMPLYKCHKEVRALKIKDVICHASPDADVSIEEFSKTEDFQGGHLLFDDERYIAKPFSAEWFRKHNPKKGGYLVVYKDGYESYSPAEAFEDGYSRV